MAGEVLDAAKPLLEIVEGFEMGLISSGAPPIAIAGGALRVGRKISLETARQFSWFSVLSAKYGDELAASLVARYGDNASRLTATNRGAPRFVDGRWVDVDGLPLPVPPSAGAAGRVPTVLQSGGRTIRSSTSNALNDMLDTQLSRREWGRALEGLKRDAGVRNDHHGRILVNGAYVDDLGEILGYIDDYI